jgi:DNA-binding XRE family transcriptional regulator
VAHTTARTQQALTPEAIGAIIEHQRASLNLTQSAAARNAKVSRGTWHHIEKGHRVNITPATMNAIDEVLGWEQGRLRSMFRPLYMGADVIIPTADGGMLVAEFKSNESQLSVPNRIMAHVARLRPDEQERLLTILERELALHDDGPTYAEMNAVKKLVERQEAFNRQVAEKLGLTNDGASAAGE